MTDKAELKAELLAQAEAAIDKLLAERKGQNSLSEVENMVQAAGQEIEQRMTGLLLNMESQTSGPGPICEQCGREMHYKGPKKRQIVTSTGEVEVERAYYYCQGCKRGYFPPG